MNAEAEGVGYVLVLLLFPLAVLAGLLGGIVGTGSSLILLPVLVLCYGPRVAVPVMAIASVLGNVGRVIAWWRHIRWRPVVAYALPGVPAAVLGVHTLLTIPPALVDGCLAGYFAGMIPLRRVAARAQWRLTDWQMALAGAGIGFLTGMILSTGPVSVPVFAAYGLAGGAFLGSEAASSLLLYAGKLATFGDAGVLSADILARGVGIGVGVMLGSLLARRVLRATGTHRYDLVIDLVLAGASIGMLAGALR